MNHKNFSFKTWLLGAIAALCFNCTENPTVAGGSAQQGNAFTVAGMVGGASGKGLAAMKVMARPSDYIPAQGVFPYDSLSAVTDAEGRFAIKGLDSGLYTLTAFDSARTIYAINRDQVVTENDSSFFLSADISARVMIPTSGAGVTALLYIPGTEIYEEVNSGDTVILTVPGVSLDITARNQSPSGYLDTVYQNVPAAAGATVAPTIVPEAPSGPAAGLVDSAYTFTATSPTFASGIVSSFEYRFSFGSSDTTGWQINLAGSSVAWSWSAPGIYEVSVQFRFPGAADNAGAVGGTLYSMWSPPLVVTITE